MRGDDRARFCNLCSLHVYNIAELTRKQAADLITKTEGRICGRVYRRADGTIITKDCPVGLRAIRRRVARISGAVFATVVAFSSAVLGQKPTKNDNSCKQQVTISRKISDKDPSAVTGTVLDPNGAVVPGAKIKITERKSKNSLTVTSNDEGCFGLGGVEPGVYDIVVESPGFKKLAVTQLTVAAKENLTLTLILTLDGATALVGIIGVSPMVDTSSPTMRTIITREMIERLPIP